MSKYSTHEMVVPFVVEVVPRYLEYGYELCTSHILVLAGVVSRGFLSHWCYRCGFLLF